MDGTDGLWALCPRIDCAKSPDDKYSRVFFGELEKSNMHTIAVGDGRFIQTIVGYI